MLPDLRTAVAAEYQSDLRAAADRRRLAAAAAPPAALRLRLGRGLALLHVRLPGAHRSPFDPLMRKEEPWKPF
jgi:hypothetical protein